MLEVDARALVQERVQSLFGEVRRTLRDAGIATASVQRQGEGIDIVLEDGGQQTAAVQALQQLGTPVGLVSLGAGTSDLAITRELPDSIRLSLTEQGVRDRIDAAVEQSLEIIRQRIDQVGVAEPTIQRVGADRILVQLPGVQDPGRIRDLLGSTAKLSFHMLAPVDPPATCRRASICCPATDGREAYPVDERVGAGGRAADATRAPASTSAPTSRSYLPVRQRRRQRHSATITRANVGKPFAIVLDGKVLSAPVIREPITGGAGQISGSFTVRADHRPRRPAARRRAAGAADRDRGAHRRRRPRQRRHPDGRDAPASSASSWSSPSCSCSTGRGD